ncbi:unnamed protein product [Cylicostephanus goldi]|uniref:Uncharacterized protein n=1 Tax=Cylicostephanus goldi TaxID=71465 RepID=A0A3P6RJC9_CYLGO|nr:unnamed protein product [Cylicostephanus goldi]
MRQRLIGLYYGDWLIHSLLFQCWNFVNALTRIKPNLCCGVDRADYQPILEFQKAHRYQRVCLIRIIIIDVLEYHCQKGMFLEFFLFFGSVTASSARLLYKTQM